MELTKVVTIRVTDTLWSDLKELAADEESSMSDIVRDMIVERINDAQQADLTT